MHQEPNPSEDHSGGDGSDPTEVPVSCIIRPAGEKNHASSSDKTSGSRRFSLKQKTSHGATDGVYVFHLSLSENHCGGDPAFIAASYSDHAISLYTSDCLKHVRSLIGPSATVAGIKFSKEHPNILYSAHQNGTINLWDTRDKSSKPSQVMQDPEARSFTSFDVDKTETFICAGTERIKEDAFLLFWDCRMCSLLGGYWECHTEDVTQVKFHPEKKDLLASGSVDGLINVYDVSLTREEDALQHTLNAEVSVEKLNWLSHPSHTLSCIGCCGDVQLWEVDGASPVWSSSTAAMADSVQNAVSVDYIVNTFQCEQDSVNVLTGSRRGCCHVWCYKDGELRMCSLLENQHRDIIRTLLWSDKYQMLVTGGEDGRICLWEACKNEDVLQLPSYKATSNLKQELKVHQNVKPY